MAQSTATYVHILRAPAADYPRAVSLLRYESPFQLLIAVMLSAQTTDARVNMITPRLFEAYPTPEHLSRARITAVESLVKSVNFYKTKARNIRSTARSVHTQYGDAIPRTMEELTALPGVGRKSASVVLSAVYGEQTIVVDTHFGRVVRRLGWTNHTNPTKIERDIAALIPRDEWNTISMRCSYHGRYVCTARVPACKTCALSQWCPKTGVSP